MTRDKLLAAYESGRRNFGGADLRGANFSWADFRGANLSGADLSGANLMGVDLRGANLSGAYLSVVDLRRTNLSGAYLGDQWIIQGGIRSDGYRFLLQKLTQDSEPMIKAGCRYFTLPEAREHWYQTRGGTQLGLETFAILDSLEALARVRGLI